MAKMKYTVGAVTDVGLQRVNNEDNFFIPGIKVKTRDEKVYSIKADYPEGMEIDGGNAFFAVCDGMGGHNAGEYASFMAVSALNEGYGEITKFTNFNQIQEKMDDFLDGINHQMCMTAEENPDMRGMGCTLCGLYFFGDNKYVPINIGDSRIYMVKGSKLIQLSVDHTDSASGKGALTRYLGLPEEFGDIAAEYGVKAETLTQKTRFLLCSDGLTDMVKEEDILHHLKNEKNPMVAADKLVDVAKKMGGVDNITTVVIDAVPVGKAVGRALRRPVTYCIAAGVLAVAIIGGVLAYNGINKAGEDNETVGISLVTHQTEIANAKTVDEIIGVLDGEDGMMKQLEKALESYKKVLTDCRNNGMKNEDYAEVSILDGGIARFEEVYGGLKSDYENAMTLPNESGEKKTKLEEIKNKISENGEMYDINEKVKGHAENAKKALNSKRAAEAPKKQAEPKKNNGGGSKSGGGAKSSGGSAPAPAPKQQQQSAPAPKAATPAPAPAPAPAVGGGR